LKNARQKMDGYFLLRSLETESARLAILDPQYRAILDQLNFGNEGGRQKQRAALPQMTDHDISLFVEQIERMLKPSGHLLLWLDKFSIGSGHHLTYFRFCNWLRIVDLLAWNTERFGMGRRLRCSTEYLLIVQKEPTRAKDKWTNNSIRDFASEKSDRDAHAHAKPFELLKTLILATTKRGDLVVDPCAGSYVVLRACRETGRDFMGCDLADPVAVSRVSAGQKGTK
jgi:site-specific DNA-methyltransferase (adenine-specific)